MSRPCGPATICIIFRSNGLTENHGETERQAKARMHVGLVSLGEVMLRLDPGDEGISSATPPALSLVAYVGRRS